MGKNLKLNQVIAITNGEKSKKQKVISKVYQRLKKKELFEGFHKEFAPIDENGEKYPPENKHVQLTVEDAIAEVVDATRDMFNLVATQDKANCEAKASVIVDDKELLTDVPVTHLLFLEKQLVDLETFIKEFPTLDPAEKWSYNKDAGCFVSEEFETHRTKKVPKPIVKYDATPEHPAQTELFTEDVIIGHWKTVKFSGCIASDEKKFLLSKVARLSKAVKIAREEANSITTTTSNIGEKVLDFIFE